MNRTPVRVALLVLAVVGCGGDEHVVSDAPPGQPDAAQPPDAAGPYGPITLDDLPVRLEDAVCLFEVKCGMMPDVATCRAVFDPGTTDVAQLTAYVAAGKLTYDATKAGECLTAYRDAACSYDGDGGLGPAAVCDAVFTGDKVEGVACFMDEECVGDLICETQACAGACCTGTCKAKPAPAAVGADCSAAPCADGAYCALDGAGGAACAERVAVGGACAAVDACAAGATCKLAPGAGQGTCVAVGGDGAQCDPGAIASCAGIDRWCDPSSSTCVARKPIGAVCGGDGECIEAGACVLGACQVRPRPGEACGAAATGGGCLGDLPCAGGHCEAEAAEAVCP